MNAAPDKRIAAVVDSHVFVNADIDQTVMAALRLCRASL